MAPPPRRPSESASVLTRWMGIAEANTAGNVHGGRIMYLCDEVAASPRSAIPVVASSPPASIA